MIKELKLSEVLNLMHVVITRQSFNPAEDERNDIRRTKPQFIICETAMLDQIMEFTDNQTIITFGDNGGRYPTMEEFLENYEQEVEELM